MQNYQNTPVAQWFLKRDENKRMDRETAQVSLKHTV